MRLAVAALEDVAELALGAGVAQVRLGIEQQVEVALVGLANRLQGRGGVGRDVRVVIPVNVDPAHALGDRPAEQHAPDTHQDLPEQLDHALLVAGLDHDQRRVGEDQRSQALQIDHGVFLERAGT